jgi:hypothetical protein
MRFHHRKGYAGSARSVPGGRATWFAEYLSTLRGVFPGGLPEKCPAFAEYALALAETTTIL